MRKHSIYDNYKIDFKENYDTKEDSYYFMFYGDKLYLNKDLKLPLMDSKSLEEIDYNFSLFIGTFYNKPCFVVDLKDNYEKSYTLHEVYTIDEELFMLGGRAIQVIKWYKTHQYCGTCGEHTILDDREMMLKCPSCGQVNYSRIAPAIIVAITHNGELLMAHHSYYRKSKIYYALLAGFVEAGESLEEAVEREVMEEVNIKVKNIKYFGSQSWPFPNSLMVGFTAEYESGEINVDNFEILEAKWLKKEDVQKMPSNISISSWLVNDYLENR